MFKLPTQAGESAIIWTDEDEDDSDGSRLRLECVDGKSWLMHTERVDDFGDGEIEVEPSAVPFKVFRARGFTPNLAIAFRSVTNLTVYQVMDAMAKGSTKMPGSKPVKVARAQGWWVEMHNEGNMSDGDVLIRLAFKRPLSAEEMMVFCRRLALWADALNEEYGDA